ncbi:MAG TPA: L-threonylcarbamoyladenylate synthase [Hyphomicrobiaceae bacterium]
MPAVPASDQAIAEAAERLRAGRLVAFPTETVYGLGADATNGTAVAGIFAAKNRPRFNPLIVHVPSMIEAERLVVFCEVSRALAQAFWPGALTLVLPKRPGCPVADLTTAGLDTLAIRMPSHPLATKILRAAGVPVAAPSANRSGRVSPTRAEHVAADMADQDVLVVDGGAAPLGVESTVVAVQADKVIMLRPGGVTAEDIARVTGQPIERSLHAQAKPLSPGQLASHYAPRADVRLEATGIAAGEAMLAFGPDVPEHDGPSVNLSVRGDLKEAAANFFAALRTLDASGAATIAVMPIPRTGLGEAINDRLQRAAAPRGG